MFKVEVTDIICNLLIVQLLGKGVRVLRTSVHALFPLMQQWAHFREGKIRHHRLSIFKKLYVDGKKRRKDDIRG